MANPTQNNLVGQRHHNNGLFSDYFLNEIIPQWLDRHPEWHSEARQALDNLKALYDDINPASLDEAQLEDAWIKPVLEQLGHDYGIQIKIRYREKGHRKPDYLLMADADAAGQLTGEIYTPEQIQHAIAVADAKKWDVNLDQSRKGERNPSQQIDEYLRYSELKWGILTNGRMWRLYERESSKYNTYYAVDLEHLITQGNADAFLYFYVFFRQTAFTGDWLTRVLRGSEEFAQKLTDTLEDEVYDALTLIAQGFLEYRRNQLKPTPQTLQLIYEQSLVLLYRLLFIFYAESRSILPLNENRDYKSNRSLSAIKLATKQKIDFGSTLDPDGSDIYSRLNDLFFAIDSGHDLYTLPAYNGRLFSATEHRFLRDNAVGDAYLVPALDKLARVAAPDKPDERVFVDYRDLDVRHLGSIYEKLLEYEIDIATEPLVISRGKYKKAAKSDMPDVPAGHVYLRTGNNERKITGSYYTPDYIVRFIVEKTLEPLLTDITEQYATLNEQGEWQVDDEAALVRAILNINVLDPATGSGHFIVDAMSYIAEWLRGLAIAPPESGTEDELIYWKRQVASSCIYAVDINPLAVELAKLSMWLTTLAKGRPLNFLDHHLRVGNSLVGASIFEISDQWDDESRLRRIERQKARDEATGQLTMFDDATFASNVSYAVEAMAQIETTVADDVSAVKQQEAQYDALRQRLREWEQAANVWTARHFGLSLTQAQWDEVREWTTTTNGTAGVPASVQTILDRADTYAREQRFFHWELAFPEVFFDAEGNPLPDGGFDAVIGNPPYVRQERIQPIKPFLETHYEVYSGTADLFLYFYEQGLRFVKPEKHLGYITSGTYMNSNSAKKFRQFIHEYSALEWVANFGENQPFRGAEMVYPTIAILRLGESDDTFKHYFMEGNVPFLEMGETLEAATFEASLSDTTAMDEWRFQAIELTRLFEKIKGNHPTLADVVDGEIYRGVVTGFNEAFIIDAATRHHLIEEHESSREIIKPMLRGSDLRPWYQIDSGEYLIFTRRGINIGNYPAIENYLVGYRDHLEPKPDDWNRKTQGRWEGRKSGSYEWYEIQDQIAYYESFEKPKIFVPDIAKLPRSSWDTQGKYCNDKGTIVLLNLSKLALINSRVLWFMLSQMATPLRLRAGLWQYQAKVQFVERLPIPELTDQQEDDLSDLAEQITALANERYQMHEDVRQTILSELGGADDEISTRVNLYEWWLLDDEKDLSDETKRRFGNEIPLKKRSEWREYLDDRKAAHQRLTDAIITHETRLNEIVYDAFDLTPDERQLIEDATKYPYGAV